jgi:ABC-2 type transport system ATP-binding protein
VASLAALEEVSFAFGERLALEGVCLTVERGEVLGLVGPNGAGKTTTLRLLTGLLAPTRGRVQVSGSEPSRAGPAARRAFGYVPDGAPLYSNLTAKEHLLLVGRLHGIKADAIDREAERLLEGLGLSDRASDPIGTFSRGMRQKAAIACALLPAPPLLILDEPLTGLDPPTAAVIKSVLRGWADRGGAVLYTSHLLDVVERVADRIAILARGRLVATGTLEELRGRAGRDGTLEQVFGALTQAQDPAAVAGRILGTSVPQMPHRGP